MPAGLTHFPEGPGSPGVADLDELLAALRFDCADPVSVQGAIRETNAVIDAKVAPYGLNSRVEEGAVKLKETYRQAILSRKTTSRNEGSANLIYQIGG